MKSIIKIFRDIILYIFLFPATVGIFLLFAFLLLIMDVEIDDALWFKLFIFTVYIIKEEFLSDLREAKK